MQTSIFTLYVEMWFLFWCVASTWQKGREKHSKKKLSFFVNEKTTWMFLFDPQLLFQVQYWDSTFRKSICSSQVIKWVMRHSWPQWTNKLSSLINVFRQGTHGHPVTQHIVQCRWSIVRCFINQCFTNVRIQHDQHYLLS